MEADQEISQFDAAFAEAIGIEEANAMAEQRKLEEQLQSFGGRLTTLFKEQVRKKADIENRWLEDLRQYYGKLSAEEEQQANKAKRSKVIVNVTRHKTNTAESRFIDMMFPADDKNWGIGPTPDADLPYGFADRIAADPQLQQMPPDFLQRMATEYAADAAKKMEKKIEDQLVEADFAAKARKMIHDAVTIGTGILKAPTVDGRLDKRWIRQGGVTTLVVEQVIEAGVEYISPWDFFPDMSARSIDECEFTFERKYLTKRQAADLLLMPGILEDQVRKAMEKGAEVTSSTEDRFSELRNISGDGINTVRSRFEMLEYRGTIEVEDMVAAGMTEALELGEADVITGTVLMLNGCVIRVSLNPLDTGDNVYSVFNWEKDNNSIFGYGVPFVIRSPQQILNASMRMMMDNGGLSVGPQVAINRRVLTPADGQYEITPKKLWFVNDETIPANAAMNVFNIPSNQQELANIYQLGRALIDEQSSLPAVATGEGDPNAAPQTATGVTIQSGAAKIVFKRAVKNFDDDVIVPIIRRFYDWNMQYSEDESIKGDFKVNARGSSTLLIREQEAKSLTELLGLTTHPVFSVMIKPDELLREILKSRQINGSNILLTEDEIKAKIEEQKQNQQQNPEMAKLQMQMQIEQAKLQQKQAELQLDVQRMAAEAQQKEQQMMLMYEIEMSKLAAQQQTTVEKLKQQAGAINAQMMIEQMREQNRREMESAKLQTQRQIAALTAQQEQSKQMMQNMNLQAGYDTF